MLLAEPRVVGPAGSAGVGEGPGDRQRPFLDLAQRLERHHGSGASGHRPHAGGGGRRGAGLLRSGRGLPLVLSLEALHAAGGVENLLLAGEEGVTPGADLHANVRTRRPGRDDLAAGARDARVHVARMNARLHASPSFRTLSIPHPERCRLLRPHRVERGPTSRRRAYPIECMEARNSRFDLVSLSLSRSSSMASTGLSWERAFLRSQTFCSSSFSSKSSSLRVPDCSMLMVGNTRLSMRRRSRCTSMLPVPLNSSKITSSIRLPVSTMAVAMMVSEPPSSMLRAVAKKRRGRWS